MKSPGVANLSSQKNDLRSHSWHLINVSNVTFKSLRASQTCSSSTSLPTTGTLAWWDVGDKVSPAPSILYLHLLSEQPLLTHPTSTKKKEGIIDCRLGWGIFINTKQKKKKKDGVGGLELLRKRIETLRIIKLPSAVGLVLQTLHKSLRSSKNHPPWSNICISYLHPISRSPKIDTKQTLEIIRGKKRILKNGATWRPVRH